MSVVMTPVKNLVTTAGQAVKHFSRALLIRLKRLACPAFLKISFFSLPKINYNSGTAQGLTLSPPRGNLPDLISALLSTPIKLFQCKSTLILDLAKI